MGVFFSTLTLLDRSASGSPNSWTLFLLLTQALILRTATELTQRCLPYLLVLSDDSMRRTVEENCISVLAFGKKQDDISNILDVLPVSFVVSVECSSSDLVPA